MNFEFPIANRPDLAHRPMGLTGWTGLFEKSKLERLISFTAHFSLSSSVLVLQPRPPFHYPTQMIVFHPPSGDAPSPRGQLWRRRGMSGPPKEGPADRK